MYVLLVSGGIAWIAARFDTRDLYLHRIFARAKRHEPLPDGRAKRFNRKPIVLFGKKFELQETRMKQIAAAQVVRAGIVVKCRGHLNEALKKHLLGIPRFEPYLFPVFMGVIKMPGIKGVKSFLEEPIFLE
jgi:hypothetical protein